MNKKPWIVIITGLSGAGKSQCLKTFEDIGFFCVDNLPAFLLENFLELSVNTKKKISKIAIAIDIRDKDFIKNFETSVKLIRKYDVNFRILYLDASDKIILQRYSETKRKHPLGKNILLSEALKLERNILEKIKHTADLTLDTSLMNIYDLRKTIYNLFSKESKLFIINLISFGYKYGVPVTLDLLLDVRFLPNPYYKAKLKRLTGLNKNVKKYIFSDKIKNKVLDNYLSFFLKFIKEYINSGRDYITLAIGCTGGKHRSVAVAEYFNQKLNKKIKTNILLVHRDIKK